MVAALEAIAHRRNAVRLTCRRHRHPVCVTMRMVFDCTHLAASRVHAASEHLLACVAQANTGSLVTRLLILTDATYAML